MLLYFIQNIIELFYIFHTSFSKSDVYFILKALVSIQTGHSSSAQSTYGYYTGQHRYK